MHKIMGLSLVFCLALCLSQLPLCAGERYLIKLKTHPDTGKTALVEKEDTMHSSSKLIGLEVKKILENTEDKQTQLFKYRETILEKPKGQDDPTRLSREYEKAQVEVLGRTTVLPWQGKTVLIEKRKGRYRFSLDGGPELTGEDAGPLADEFQSTRGPTSNFTDLAPDDKAVRVEDNHDIDPKALLKVYGSLGDAGIKIDAAKAKGTWKLTRAYKKEGRQFGVIELHVELPLREMKWTHPKAADKLVMRPGAKMTLHGVIDGCIDGSAAIATSTFDMTINGTAPLPAPDNPQFDLILSIKTSTKETSEESSPRGTDIKKLGQARVEAAFKAHNLAIQAPQKGIPGVRAEDVYTWSVRGLNAQLDLSRKKADRISALDDHLQRMQDLAGRVDLLKKAGAGSPLDSSAADFYLREAELWLAQAKATAKKADKP